MQKLSILAIGAYIFVSAPQVAAMSCFNEVNPVSQSSKNIEAKYMEQWKEAQGSLKLIRERLEEVTDNDILNAAATMARKLHDNWWNVDHASAMEKQGKTKLEPKYKAIKAYTFTRRAEAQQKINELEASGFAEYRIAEPAKGQFVVEQNYAKPSAEVDPELNMQMNGSLTTSYVRIVADYLRDNPNPTHDLPGAVKSIHDTYIEAARWEIGEYGLMGKYDSLRLEFEILLGHSNLDSISLSNLYSRVATIVSSTSQALRNEMGELDWAKFRQFQDVLNLNQHELFQDRRTFLEGTEALANTLRGE